MAVVLKEKHTLRGVLPVVLELKASQEPPGPPIARLKIDHPLSIYKLEELVSVFRKLSGEDLLHVLSLAGKTHSVENAVHAVHLAIIQANNTGAPRGSSLREPLPQPNSDVVHDHNHGESLSEGGCPTQPSVSVSSASPGINPDLEGRMRKLEETWASQHKQTVDDAVKNVRTLASRPKLVTPGVLLAALEVLVENASLGGHSDKDYYQKALTACRQFEEHPDLCGLCLKLLGSSDDRKIATGVAEWVKSSRKSESVKGVSDKIEEAPKPPGFTFTPTYNIPQGYPFALSPPMFPFGGPAMHHMGPGYQNFSPGYGNQGRQGGRQKTPRKKGPCFFCKEVGHLLSECPKYKKE